MRDQVLAIGWLGVLGLGLGAPSTAAGQQECLAPRVLIVLDKSSSMLGDTGDGQTKWDAAEQAIGSVTTAQQSGIDFGLMIFPDPDECGPGSVVVDCAADSADDIAAALGDPPPQAGNWTPMAQSLAAAGQYDPLSDPERRGYVLLVTDGWQWCSPYDAATRFTPVDEVAALQARGITTYVVGFGDGVDVLTLNRSAAAGGAPRPGCDPEGDAIGAADLCYYQADDVVSLEAALDDITADLTEEVCDGTDNDCDGEIDEGFDRDGDGVTICDEWPDCDDDDPDVNPWAWDDCNGLDDDCDGVVDPGCDCRAGDERTCGVCGLGSQICVGGAWGDCDETPPEEDCNGLDDDCDGTIDEAAPCPHGMVCRDGECIDPSPEDPDAGAEVPPDEGGGDGDVDSDADADADRGGHDGPGGDADADADDTDTGLGGTPPQNIDGGCACRAARGPDRSSTAWGALLLAALVLAGARRRRTA